MFAELNQVEPIEPSSLLDPPPVRQAAQIRNREAVLPETEARAAVESMGSLTC